MRNMFADRPEQPAESTPLNEAEPAGDLMPPAKVDLSLPLSPEIMEKLTGFMRRFLVCSDEQLTLLALWVLHTYCISAFHVTPCLNICSAERRTGKSTCLQLLRCLCPGAWYAIAPAPAVVIQMMLSERGAILLDDRHLTFSPSGRHQVVNCLTCACVNDELYFASTTSDPVEGHNVFGPLALAGRGPLPASLADRSIPIFLRSARPSSVKRVRFIQEEPDYQALADMLQSWAAENCDQLSGVNVGSSAEELSCLNSHQQAHVEPLLLLARFIGGHWPEKTHQALTRVFRDARNERTSQSIQLLHDIREAFHGSGDPPRLTTSYLVEHLSNLPTRPWAEWNEGKAINGRSLALLLERFDIAPDKQRTGAHGSVRGYDRNAFLPHWQQYFDDLPEARRSTSSTGTGTATGTAL